MPDVRSTPGAVAALALLVLVGGCRKTDSGPTDVDVVASVSVTPGSATLTSAGATAQLTASAARSDGSTISGTSFTWASDAAGVATVSGSGLVTAVANGTATITASASGQSGSATVTVAIATGPSPAQVVVEPDSATLTAVAQTVQLSLAVIDTNGDTIASPAGAWTTSDAGVATVSTGGLVTAVADGSVSVAYTLGTLADTARIIVSTGPPPAVVFDFQYDAGGPADDVWGLGPDDYWAVGDDGLISRYTGNGWENVTPGVTNSRLSAIWGSAGNDIWAAGQFGEIVHYDGTGWTTATSPTSDWILDMEGLAADDIWGVGHFGEVVHYDGSTWSSMATPTTQILWGVYPVASDDVWAVGDNATILHYDGTTWSEVSHGTGGNDFTDILVLAADDIWVSGSSNVIHYDGVSWSVAQSGLPEFTEMWAVSPTEAWGVSAGAQFVPGQIWSFDGATWTNATPAGNVTGRFNGVFGSSGSDVWAVGQTTGGAAGTVAWHWDGAAWMNESAGLLPHSISDAWGSGPSDIWAVTARLGILHYDGTQWSDETVALDDGQGFNAIWGSAANDIWAVGGSSTQIFHYDGTTWADAGVSGSITGGYAVNDIWGTASNDVWAVQPLGRIIHFDGTSWSQSTQSIAFDPLYAVWASGPNDVYVGGGSTSAVMLHWDGTQWTDVGLGLSGDVRDIWGAAPDDIYAVTSVSGLIHWDGTSWTPVSTPFTPGSVTGSSATDVWIAGYPGRMAQWDGTQWTDLSVELRPDRPIQDVWIEPGVSDGPVWAFGSAGVILRGTR